MNTEKKLNINLKVKMEVQTVEGNPFFEMDIDAKYHDAPLDVLHFVEGTLLDAAASLPKEGQAMLEAARNNHSALGSQPGDH